MDRHRLAEERSIALHLAVAAKLGAEPAVLERARDRVRRWRETGAVAGPYVDVWEGLLALDRDALCAALVDPSEAARAYRQASPFAGALDPRERWRIWRRAAPRQDRA